MTGLESTLLLLGFFGMPVLLLVNGHRFRRLGRRMRGAFWGGVIGYASGILVWELAAIAPAAMWSPESARFAIIVLPLALFGIAGFALGALVGNKPKRRQHRHRKERRAALPAHEHEHD